jgi:hypothetical protein
MGLMADDDGERKRKVKGEKCVKKIYERKKKV